MTQTSVVALGVAQCVNWGVLYYSFAVFVVPLEREMRIPGWAVAGALSLGLFVSALLAPVVGKWCDRGRGPLVMQSGGFVGGALLILWPLVPHVVGLYVMWTGLGFSMAATLYEPAFVVLGRAFKDDQNQRLRALATVTVLGGLASTVFMPLSALLVARVGWRATAAVLGALLIGSTAAARFLAFQRAAAPEQEIDAARVAPPPELPSGDRSALPLIALTFTFASLASAAFTANLIPALSEQHVSAAAAAVLGGIMGLMQLPGRALLMFRGVSASPQFLVTLSLGLQACGLALIALSSSIAAIAAGTILFAVGGGLMTLLRPHVVGVMFSGGYEGHLNGRIARLQHLARAAGPLALAWTASYAGYSKALTALSIGFVLVALAWRGTPESTPVVDMSEEAL